MQLQNINWSASNENKLYTKLVEEFHEILVYLYFL